VNRFQKAFLVLRMLPRTGTGRARLLRRYFNAIGDNTVYQTLSLPAEPHLVSIGSNVTVASGVKFVTHDVIGYLFNNMTGERRCTIRVGRIDIGDNVFIGSNATVLYDTQIGSGSVVAACALAKGVLEPGGVYGGVPAKRLCSLRELQTSYEEYAAKVPWKGVRDQKLVVQLQKDYYFPKQPGEAREEEQDA
jgi:acetyltransferase-like isoleucine patch superfamily enzyme